MKLMLAVTKSSNHCLGWWHEAWINPTNTNLTKRFRIPHFNITVIQLQERALTVFFFTRCLLEKVFFVPLPFKFSFFRSSPPFRSDSYLIFIKIPLTWVQTLQHPEFLKTLNPLVSRAPYLIDRLLLLYVCFEPQGTLSSPRTLRAAVSQIP